MTTPRIVLSLIWERERESKEKEKDQERERESVFNQGQILIWHVLARAIKYNHQKAHHLFSLLCFGTPPSFSLFHRNQHPSFRLVLALSNWISPGERRGWEDEGEGCLGNDRGFLDVVAGATCNQRPLNMRQEPQRREEELEEKWERGAFNNRVKWKSFRKEITTGIKPEVTKDVLVTYIGRCSM